jgi:cell division protein FtsW (lipid II flippase)
MAHLHDYSACPDSKWPGCLKGHGYLAIPRPTVLAPYQLNDNVTAIHLIAPFGRAGAASFLLLLAAAALLYTRAALRREEAPSPLLLAGIAAMWTIFGAALYMMLANLEILPFTGKNVYFLAAASGSDLLEGTILIALAMAAAVRTRP